MPIQHRSRPRQSSDARYSSRNHNSDLNQDNDALIIITPTSITGSVGQPAHEERTTKLIFLNRNYNPYPGPCFPTGVLNVLAWAIIPALSRQVTDGTLQYCQHMYTFYL